MQRFFCGINNRSYSVYQSQAEFTEAYMKYVNSSF